MPAPYKTPGVYIEEIVKFPPSIAPVETAIPIFLGYTEKITRNGENITNKAMPIGSIADFEEVFGGGPRQDVEVVLDSADNFVKATASGYFYLYDSLRLFYANGGGKCYVVSLGDYTSTPGQTAFEKGLNAVALEDEPTIIILSDAVSTGNLYDLQKAALELCKTLKDRVLLCDLAKPADPAQPTEYEKHVKFDATVKSFKDGIGINNLKYGMAYAPWINVNLPRVVWRKNLKLKRDQGGTVELEDLTSDAGLKSLIADLKLAEKAGTNLANVATFTDDLQKAVDDYNTLDKDEADAGVLAGKLEAISAIAIKALDAVAALKDPANQYPARIKQAVDDYLNDKVVEKAVLNLAAHHQLLIKDDDPIAVIKTGAEFDTAATLFKNFTKGDDLLGDELPDVTGEYQDADDPKPRADVARLAACRAASAAIAMFSAMQATVAQFERNSNETLLLSFGKFKDLATKGAEALNLLPPSGAIAGVYATVDRERGVWKAPANVSLNAVTGPSVKITQEQQGEYNVDVNAGKSINIIRAFTGKGVLVWGARTLAGNDNEWRYVNVRRFFNFVEESCKKATEQFVFEPNDANTWVRVQGMIESFLTVLWRQGALQGVKPEHAFYVAVGLGKTMTALDILEGRMIVEIGMAAVRPAEFIILRFSHKMPES